MAVQQRQAQVVWQGDLKGTGRISVGSEAFGPLDVTYSARTENAGGKTSPEELIAAAHATCFSMAFSNTLAKAGNAPEKLEVKAVCTLDRVEGKLTITHMDLDVTGRVAGLTPARFAELAAEAERGCPVSKALHGNVEIRLNAHLAG